MRKLSLMLLALPFLFTNCSNSESTRVPTKSPKYVFMFLGDGMGLNQVHATELFLAAKTGKLEPASLSFSNFPVQSFQTTQSANSWVTCSSASATAFATGHKTNNGAVCKDTSLKINYETIAEKAKKAGYKVGILSSVYINHATPACYYAHQDSRSMYYEISLELPKSGFDYFGGGGFHYPTGEQLDKENAYDIAKANAYSVINTREAFDTLENGDTKVLAINPKLYSEGEFYWGIDDVKDGISLAEFTKKGIEVLDNDKGFFMMIEGGKIDWACHSNDAGAMIHETLAFGDAVSEAVKFYNEHKDETLIIVTADHETGGIVLGNGNDPKMGLFENQKISLQEFVRKASVLKESNPKVSFDEVMDLAKQDFGLGNASLGLGLSKEEKNYLYEGYKFTFKNQDEIDPDADYLAKKGGNSFPERVVALLNQKAGVSWASNNHSGSPVPIRVMGVGQEMFKSGIDNTDIPKIIGELMGVSN